MPHPRSGCNLPQRNLSLVSFSCHVTRACLADLDAATSTCNRSECRVVAGDSASAERQTGVQCRHNFGTAKCTPKPQSGPKPSVFLLCRPTIATARGRGGHPDAYPDSCRPLPPRSGHGCAGELRADAWGRPEPRQAEPYERRPDADSWFSDPWSHPTNCDTRRECKFGSCSIS